MMSTRTLKDGLRRGVATDNADTAVKILYENEYHSAMVYAHTRKEMWDLYEKICSEIKKRNSLIQNIDEQMLVSESTFEAVHQCMHVYVAEIDIGPFATKATTLHLFSDVNYDVLTDPTARRPLCDRAVRSLALMGHMATVSKRET